MWYYVGDEDFKWSKQSLMNIPPRIRMTMLYALAQTFNGRVVGTCNKSELYVGYATRYGDMASDFEPLGKHYMSTGCRGWSLFRKFQINGWIKHLMMVFQIQNLMMINSLNGGFSYKTLDEFFGEWYLWGCEYRYCN